MNKRQKKKQFKKQELIKLQKASNNQITDQIIEENRLKKESVCGKTQKLYRKKEEIIDEIIFDQYSFVWKIYHHQDGETEEKEFCIEAKEKIAINPEIEEKINIYRRNDIDKNLIYALSAFDSYHENSTAVRDCLTDSLKCKVTYDLSRKPKNKSITEETLEKVKEGALNEKKLRKSKIIRFRNSVIGAALIGLTLVLGITGINSNLGKKQRSNAKDNNTKKVETETQTEELVTETEKIANTTIKEVLETTAEVTTQEQTAEEINTAEEQKEIIIEDNFKEEKINNDIKLNDVFKLEDTVLVDDTRNPRKKAYTSKLKCDEYKIALTAVLVNKKIVAIDGIEELENISLKEIETKYKNIYGEDAQVYVNFNGFKEGFQQYTYIGWGNIDEFKDMKTSNNQNNISRLRKMKNQLLSSKSFQKIYKI